MTLTPETPHGRPAPRARRHVGVGVPAGQPVLLWGDSERHPNIFYRSHFLAGDPFAVVDSAGAVTVWVNSMEVGRATKEAAPGVQVRSFDELPKDPVLEHMVENHRLERSTYRLIQICRAQNLAAVTVERDFPTLEADELRARGIAVSVNPSLYQRERRIKTQSEVLAIKATQDAGQDALQRAIDVIKAAEIRNGLLYRDGRPLTGQDLVSVVETRLLELGCGAEATICCGGPDSSDPHKATSPVLRAGLPIVLDIFPYNKSTRMWGDMTRTVVRGTPDPEVLRMWDAVRAAQQAGLDAIRPGVTGAEIHRIVCETLKRHGYASDTDGFRDVPSRARMLHSTGHGVGLEVHEDPRVGRDGDSPLQPGDVITVEPGLYDPRLGGIRIEDLVVVTRSGYRQLTPLPKIFVLDSQDTEKRPAA